MKNGSPSPPRAPPHPSQNFYRLPSAPSRPARRRVAAMSPGGMTNRRLDGNSRPVCLVVQVLAGLWASVALQVTTAEVWTSKVFGGMGGGGGGKGPFVHKGALPPRHIMQQYTVIACLFFGREAFFHKRLPSPNLSLPKNFTGSLAGQFGPARRRVAAMSPGGMTNRRLDGNSRPVCLVVQVLAGLWASVALQVTTAEVWTSKVFGGMGGGGGKGPFVHKGALPPTKKKQTPPPPKITPYPAG